jgi:hypothetical protein
MLFSFPFRSANSAAARTPARPAASYPFAAAGHAWVGSGTFSPIQPAARQPLPPPARKRLTTPFRKQNQQHRTDPKLDALRLQLTRMANAVQLLKQRFVQFATVAEQMGSVAKNVTADALNIFSALEMDAPTTLDSFMRLQERLAAHIVNVFKKEFDANLTEVVRSWLSECESVEREVTALVRA